MVNWEDAQIAVIGSALIDPDCVPLLMSELRPEDLTGNWRSLYETIVELKLRGAAIDPVTVLHKAGEQYRADVLRAMQETPTAANAAAYAAICKERSRLTRISSLGIRMTEAATLDDARELLQQAQAVAVEQAGSGAVDMNAALSSFFERHQKGEHKYISVGLPALDERLTLDAGDVLVLGGYPSDGKTALMLQWCWRIAGELPVGIFSFETSADKLMDRLVTQAVPGMQFTKVKRGKLDAKDWKAVTAEIPEITRRRLQIVEAAGMTAADVLGVALAKGFRVIAIDYVQLISPGTVRKGGTRAEEVAEISKALALMARRHKLLVIELSQLQRPQKSRDGKTPAPTLSSLRESGQLEQDADVVALLYRTGESETAPRNLFIAKNKEGRRGLIALRFNGERQTFAYIAPPDIPPELQAASRNRKEAEKNQMTMEEAT